MSVVQELDKTLFEGYVKPKASVVMGLIREGILDPDMDWYETPQPTGMSSIQVPIASNIQVNAYLEIRPYMYEALMYLVGVHAQISSAAEPLLERIMNALVEDLAEEALRCFRQVKRFGMGGMLRVSYSCLSTLDKFNDCQHYFRLHSKSSSCTRHCRAMSRLLRKRRYQIYTIRSHKHTLVGKEMRTSRVIWMASRRLWLTPAVRLG